MPLPVYANFVHGEFLPNHSSTTFPVKNPATDQIIYEVELADQHVCQRVIESAKHGFTVWSSMAADRKSVV